MKVVIVGMGEIGVEVAKSLVSDSSHDLVLIDRDGALCEQIAEDIDALVIEGDGTQPEILRKAQIESAEALVATTGSDPINTVVAILGRQFGVETVIVKLKGLGLRAACQEIGVSKIIAPAFTAAAEIRDALTGFSRLDFSIVSQRGGLHFVDLDASEVAGTALGDLDIPSSAHLVALVRSERLNLPNADTKLESGDILLMLVEGEEGREAAVDALSAKREEETEGEG